MRLTFEKIMDKLDTGDILLLKTDCNYTLTSSEYLECYKSNFTSIEKKSFDKLGIVIRHDSYNVSVLTNLEKDKIENIWYPDLLALPLFNEIKARRLMINADNDFKRLFSKRALLLYYQVQALNAENQKLEDLKNMKKGAVKEPELRRLLQQIGGFFATPDGMDGVVDLLEENGYVDKFHKFEELDELKSYKEAYKLFLEQMGIVRKIGGEYPEYDLYDLNQSFPGAFNQNFALDKRIVIRNSNNVDLFRSEFDK